MRAGKVNTVTTVVDYQKNSINHHHFATGQYFLVISLNFILFMRLAWKYLGSTRTLTAYNSQIVALRLLNVVIMATINVKSSNQV